MSKSPSQVPIAIVGASAIFPGSIDKTGFWNDILAGTDRITDVPASHWLIEDYYDPDPSVPDMTYGKRGAFLENVDFDALDWGVPPALLPQTDTVQLLALIAAQRVLEDAIGGSYKNADLERTSVILGVTSAQDLLGKMVSRLQHPIWRKSLRDMGLPEDQVDDACKRIASHYADWEESTFPGLLGNVVAGRIANRLDLGGTNCVTDAACASSFSAISMAVNELSLHQSDLVISGGCDTMNDIFMYMCFSKTPALSQRGDIAPFSDQADGTLLGEGLGMVALKRLEDAERDGDTVYAVLKGVGGSSDGRSKSVYAPVSAGQARAITRAYDLAGFSTDTVELVEAHGTGTKAGDAAEFGGLELAFNSDRTDRQWCALGTVKSQIGHTKAAAGAAGLFKAVMALHHKVLPPTIKIEQPNPKLGLKETPFYLNTKARPWIRDATHPRRAGISSFGFGGSNFHLAVEEYQGDHPADRLRTVSSELVIVTGRDPSQVLERAVAIRAEIEPGMLTFLAHRQASEAVGPCRIAIVAADEEALAAKLDRAIAHLKSSPTDALQTPDGVFFSPSSSASKAAILFPGQGSQYLEMGAGLAMAFDAARSVWDRAASVEHPTHPIVFPPPVFSDAERDEQTARLTSTEWAQPAIGTHSLATWALLGDLGVKPSAVGGHSFGEVIALHAGGSLSFDDALSVARRRGELMAEAAQQSGAMAAIPAEIAVVEDVLAGVSNGCVVANHNSPTQVVISGPVADVEAAITAFAGRGLEAKRLSVATAFHSEVVAGSVAPFLSFLSDVSLKKTKLPVYANSKAAPYPTRTDSIRKTLGEQIAKPVRFVEQIEAMYAAGIRTFIECGPSNVLTNLTKKILKGRPHTAVSTDRKRKDDVTAFHLGLAEAFVAGVDLELSALWNTYGTPVDPRTLPKPKMAVAINGSNVGQPYPPPNGAAGVPGPNPPKPAPEPEIIYVDRPVAVPTPVQAQPNHQETAMSTSTSWVAAFAEAQRQTAEAHATYQSAMAHSHQAYLRTVEASFVTLSSLATGAPVSFAAAPQFASPSFPSPSFPAPAPAIVPAPVVHASPAVSAPVIPVAPAPVVAAPAPVVHAAPAPVRPAPAPVVATAASSMDLKGLLMDVVADKTGYPAEMLNLQMSLEGDLGIDSIKRVEILSAMREREPGLPEVDAGEMSALSTLGEIVDYMDRTGGASAAPAGSPAAAPSMDLKGLLMDVVADKTGYPAEMLNLQMSLEGDLGIDSIKRVEILSAMREREPGLPEVDAGEMSALSTLGEIVDYMDQTGGASAAPAGSLAAAPSMDLKGLLMDVVADKTGYPAEMLNLQMSLEGDLGIDSIKRVEILSAMREREPGLPEVDAGEMSALSTLGEIVDYMDAGAVNFDSARHGVSSAMSGPEVAMPADMGRYALELVEAPALGMSQPGLQKKVWVTGEERFGPALADELLARGVDATYATPSALPDDLSSLIYLGGLREDSSAAAGREVMREAFQLAHTYAAGLSSGLFVTVQDTGGDFGLSGTERCWMGGLPGLTKTAAQEWVNGATKAIDIRTAEQSIEEVAERLCEELLAGGSELEVALSANRRTLQSVKRTPAPGPSAVAAGDVVVVSGGARGVTAACVVSLAHATQARFVLLGRTQLVEEPAAAMGIQGDADLKRALMKDAIARGEAVTPAGLGKQVKTLLACREIRGTLASIQAVGGEGQYVAVDVTDAAGIHAALTQVRADWGPVKLVIHGAGVLADKLIAEKTVDQFDFVFDTKIGGLLALMSATEDDAPGFVQFSSVAGRCGNQGQCDYAMANEVLNKVTHRLAADGRFAKSMGWGPWAGGMVTPALKARFESLGVPLIPLDVGAKMMVDELMDGTADRELVLGGEPKAEALAAESDTPSTSVALHVDATSHPWLHDHTIGGRAVVPVVVVMEWFASAAKAMYPHLALASIKDVGVLNGIKIDDLEVGTWLQLDLAQLDNGVGCTLSATLSSPSGRKHYRALVRMEPAPLPLRGTPPAPTRAPYDSTVYDGELLFHGEAFQVLDTVSGLDDGGASATISGTLSKSWKGTFRTDPAAFDGGLQLALLWSRRVLGGHSLPMAVGALTTYEQGPITGPLQANLTAVRTSQNKAVSDIVFTREDGAVYAELKGIETVLRPR